MNPKTDTGEYSLSKLFDLHLEPIRAELKHLSTAIEKMSRNSISYSEFKVLKERVDKLEGLDDRIDKLEQSNSIGGWLLDKGVVILVALVIGYLSSLI